MKKKYTGVTPLSVLRELDASWQALKSEHNTTPKFSRKALKTNESKFLDYKMNYRGMEELQKLKSVMTPGGSTKVTSIVDPFVHRNESKETKEAILYNATCIAPLHKGTYIYISAGINPAGLGRKNEVL